MRITTAEGLHDRPGATGPAPLAMADVRLGPPDARRGGHRAAAARPCASTSEPARRAGTDHADPVTANGRSVEAGAGQAPVRRPALVLGRRLFLLQLPRPEDERRLLSCNGRNRQCACPIV